MIDIQCAGGVGGYSYRVSCDLGMFCPNQDIVFSVGTPERLRNAVQACIAKKESTPDLDGTLKTDQVTKKVIERL